MREITPNEVSKLYDCIRELSDYHNTTSVNFKGFYPLKPYEKTLESFEAALREKTYYAGCIIKVAKTQLVFY